MWLLSGAVVLVASAGLYAVIKRRRFRELRWPAGQLDANMLRRIGKYLAWTGWDVPEVHGATFDAIVIRRNKSGDCIVKCCFLVPDTRRLAVQDLEEAATFRLRPHTRLLVAAQEITPELVLEGRKRNVFVIYYKSLDQVARLNPVSMEDFQAGLRRIGDSYLSDEQRRERTEADAKATLLHQNDKESRPAETAPTCAPVADQTSLSERLAAGSAALQRRDLDAATHIFREVQARDPNHIGAASGLAAALGQLGQMKAALTAIRHAVALRPRDAMLRTQYGQLLGRSGDWTGAEVELRAVLAADPNRIGALTGLSAAVERQGRLEEATLFQAKAVELAPDRADLHAQLGKLLLHQRAYAQAEAAFSSGLAADPSHLGILGGLVATLRTQGKLKEAIEVIRTAGPSAAKDTELLLCLATLLEADQQLREASEVFQEVLRVSPGNTKADVGLKRTLAHCKVH